MEPFPDTRFDRHGDGGVRHRLPAVDAPLDLVTVDLYRDVHKGIRRELFAATSDAARVDHADAQAVEAVVQRVRTLEAFLRSHARHEDAFLAPVLTDVSPALAWRVDHDHDAIERHIDRLLDVAHAAATGGRRGTDRLHLVLASFTGEYLRHQDLEESEVMPALEGALGPDATGVLNARLVAAIPPDEMGAALAVMLPAMNVDEQVELLRGIRDSAPPAAYAGVRQLASAVLTADELLAVLGRLEPAVAA